MEEEEKEQEEEEEKVVIATSPYLELSLETGASLRSRDGGRLMPPWYNNRHQDRDPSALPT